jgi:hypothetical protein
MTARPLQPGAGPIDEYAEGNDVETLTALSLSLQAKSAIVERLAASTDEEFMRRPIRVHSDDQLSAGNHYSAYEADDDDFELPLTGDHDRDHGQAYRLGSSPFALQFRMRNVRFPVQVRS